MIINKLKSILIMSFCFITLCLDIKSLDNSSELQERTQLKILKCNVDNENSWSSFLMSPLKSTIGFTNDLIRFTSQNQKYVIMLGLMLTIEAVDASLKCYCYCTDAPLTLDGQPQPIGLVNDLFTCQKSCQEIGWGNVSISESIIAINKGIAPFIFSYGIPFYYPACGNHLDYAYDYEAFDVKDY